MEEKTTASVADTLKESNFRNEIIIGLVGALGVDFQIIIDSLKKKIERIGYNIKHITLSDQIKKYNPYLPTSKRIYIKENPENERIKTLMDAGDELREYFERGDAVGVLALNKLRKMRENEGQSFNNAYILKSLKHPEEVITLRRIYGPGFFLIGIHASHEKRKKTLSKAIANSLFKTRNQEVYDHISLELMNRDKNASTNFGQKVSKTFHLADVFVSLDDEKRAEEDIERFIELIFGNPHITPTKDEYAMFIAYATSLKSGDLSRQVGAAITNKQGEILSAGTNDVPSPEGGLYWEDSEPKKRDYDRGNDSNKEKITNLINEIESKLRDEYGDKFEDSDLHEILRKTELNNITEFGRSVHAEMDAITQAARLGVSIKDSELFTTLFPCHNCTKHIIASGIKRVVYIEPYPKSLAEDLHDDAITVDQKKNGKVLFKTFIGVGPYRFLDLFSLKTRTLRELVRKGSDGKVIEWCEEEAIPRLPLLQKSFLEQEDFEISEMLSEIKEKKEIKTTIIKK